MVGRVSAFLKLVRRALPGLLAVFEPKSAAPRKEIAQIYEAIDSANFSQDVLAISASSLAVLPVKHAGWTDLGEPERVRNALRGDLGSPGVSLLDEP